MDIGPKRIGGEHATSGGADLTRTNTKWCRQATGWDAKFVKDVEAVMEETDKMLEGVLDEAQMAKYREMRAQQRRMRQERRGQPAPQATNQQ